MITRQTTAMRPMQTLIRGRVVNASRLARILGTSQPTAQRRLDDPSTITIGELYRLVDARVITGDEARDALRFNR